MSFFEKENIEVDSWDHGESWNARAAAQAIFRAN